MRNLKSLFVLTAIMVSCQKEPPAPEPIALFNFYHQAPGIVRFENISTNANEFIWDFGEGNSSTDRDPLHNYYQNGTYNVTLKALGVGGQSTINRTVVVSNIPTTGKVVFWSTLNKRVKIYINGTFMGTSSKYMTQGTAPNCGTEGFVTVTLPQGTYNFRGEEDALFGSTWSGQIDVFNGQCRTLRLTD